MEIQIFDIISSLQPYIRNICTVEFAKNERSHCIRVLPDTCVELFINFGDSPLAEFTDNKEYNYKRSIVTSRMNRYMDVTRHLGSSCIAICFKPGQAYRFFSVPMSELSNKVIELEDLWQSQSRIIEEKLALAVDNEQRSVIIQEFLLSLLVTNESDFHMLHAFELIHAHKGGLSIENLSKETNISHRQLSRRFHRFMGLSPKEYANMSRFLYSLKVLKTNPQLSLTQITYESGYYDQAHFIHECRRYTGVTPTELLTSKNILF
jgi:AraC-like DNA-binding protein